MTVSTRRLRPEDLPEALRCFERAIGLSLPDNDSDRVARLLNFEGSFVTTHGPDIVGVLGAYRFGLSTPGGDDLAAAGTTLVGVQPTHRRRGALNQMMRAHLDWAREEGLDAVGLWASEPQIYPRFGFGLATERGGWTVDARSARLDEDESSHELRYVDIDSVAAEIQAVYADRRGDRAGALTRDDTWWRDRRWDDAPWRRGSASAFHYVIARRDGATRGYLQYRRESRWDQGSPSDLVQIEELIGDPSSRRALWGFLLSLDLVSEVRAFNFPVDDVLPLGLENRRHARLFTEDALYLAPLSPARLLIERDYAVDDALTLQIDGPTESWVLDLEVVDRKVACDPSRRQPDLRLMLKHLPGLAWGDTTPELLAEAGRIEGGAEAVRRLGRLLRTGRRPWCPERF